MDNLEMKKLDGLSMDVVSENKKKLMELFPEVFTEEGIILDKLKTVFGEYVEDKDDYYNFTWNGKDKALRLSQAQSTGTLRPCKEESKNWDTTQNLYIEGDNLEVLMLLRKSYHGKIKMIYIDPPYNTGKDFVYKDNYQDNLKNYLEMTNQVRENGRAWGTNSDQSGRYHTDWLNMMLPRLRIARDLLTDDGVIFISIDDYEMTNLKKITDELFGEDNFVEMLVWVKKTAPNNVIIGSVHEYILVYAKNKANVQLNLLPRTKEDNKKYSNPDNDPRGPWMADNITSPAKGGRSTPSLVYELKNPFNGEIHLPPKGRMWSVPKDEMDRKIKEGTVIWGKNNQGRPMNKRYLEDTRSGKVIQTVITDGGSNSRASKEIQSIFDGEVVFETPKPTELLSKLVQIGSGKGDIILDFFSGSATIAHSVFKVNLSDSGKRKYIIAQIPEQISEKSEPFKLGYKNFCEIGKERVRRAGDRLIEENKDMVGIENLDIGFKVFKLDSSNIKKWDANNQNLEDYLNYMVDNFVEGRTEEDVLYEIMLKYGIDLTAPIESRNIAGKNVYSIGFGALFVCLDMEITIDVVEGIVAYKDELVPARTSIIFRDNGFKDSTVKTNALQILRTNDIEEVMSI